MGRELGKALLLAGVLVAGGCDDKQPQNRGGGGAAGSATAEGGTGALGGDATEPRTIPDEQGGGAPSFTPISPPCNGWAALCARPYSDVVYPVARAAAANMSPPWDYPAQRQPLHGLLQSSIRGLTLEVHELAGELVFCLGDCDEGHTPVANAFDELGSFLHDNAREVVTLIVDNHVPAARLFEALAASNLASLIHAQPRDAAWPTLGELVAAGQRLVVFAYDAADAPPEILSWWDFAAATRAGEPTLEELDCDIAEGDAGAGLLLLNHFLVVPPEPSDAASGDGGTAGALDEEPIARADPDLAVTINRNPFLLKRLQGCAAQHGRLPTFVAVDFADTSDVVAASQAMNQLLP